MSKERKSNKQEKKKPAMTAKEKKQPSGTKRNLIFLGNNKNRMPVVDPMTSGKIQGGKTYCKHSSLRPMLTICLGLEFHDSSVSARRCDTTQNLRPNWFR